MNEEIRRLIDLAEVLGILCAPAGTGCATHGAIRFTFVVRTQGNTRDRLSLLEILSELLGWGELREDKSASEAKDCENEKECF